MISYWVTEDGRSSIGAYRQNRGRAIADRFQMHLYEKVGRTVRVPGGAQIFSALDQLSERQRTVVAAIWDAHARAVPDAARLNDPRRVLLRFQLLRRLHEQGVNAYRVFRATDLNKVDRFPVFVRHMHDHSGPRTRLLGTRRDVIRALCGLRLRGYRLRDLMIVEFCDTSRRDGLFRKFAAFKVGNTIIPCHLFVSRHWCVKSIRNEPTEGRLREANKFIEENPHIEWLRRVFSAGGIDYGRVDYGMLDGVPQVWEINLNPTIGRPTGWRRSSELAENMTSLRDSQREAFHERLRAAFVALDVGHNVSDVTMTIDESLVQRLEVDAAADRRRARVLTRLSGLRHHPQLGLPTRAVLKLFPRRH
jgi:hypothetical protein